MARTPPSDSRTRTFDPLPPTRGSRAPFATSWWGTAWVTALEQSSLDAGRLQRGRSYARTGKVHAVTVSPGLLTAPVQGSRPRPYRSSVRVQELTDRQWERLLDTIAERAANIAALLDRDMPPGLADDAKAAGVTLLPGPRDLDPDCSCPDWGYPCKHAAALCYQTARLLDQDPFVLLLLRGRTEHQLMEELHRRNAAHAATQPAVQAPTATSPAGAPARDVFAARDVMALPKAPPLPEAPGRGPALAGTGPAEPGFDPAALEILAGDAAMRAHHLLAEALSPTHHTSTPPPTLTEWQDTARIAATHPDRDLFTRLTTACDRPAMELAAATRAWRHGGTTALEVLDEAWSPPAAVMERARTELKDEWPDGTVLPRLRIWRNRFTVEGHPAQLRYGPDGRWYPYAKDGTTWWPAGPPDPDPAVVLTTLLQPEPTAGRPSPAAAGNTARRRVPRSRHRE